MTESERPSNELTAAINFDSLFATFNQRLSQVVTHASLGLVAIDQLEDGAELVPLPNVVMHTIVGGGARKCTPATREACRAWLIGVCLRDGFESFAGLCDDVLLALMLIRRSPIRLPGGSIELDLRILAQSFLPNDDLKVREWNVFEKLKHLRRDFDIGSSYSTELKSLQLARNCLTHNGGVIAKRHLNAGGKLIIHLKVYELSIESPSGEVTRNEGAEPVSSSEGRTISVRLWSERQKSFRLGESLEFTNQEAMHLITTLHGAGIDLVNRVKASFARDGIAES